MGPNFADDLDCCGFFDQIDDLLDFPNEDVVDAGFAAADCAAFPSIWTDQSESLPGSDSVFSNNSNSDLSAEISVPYEEIVHLEWLSNFVDDSFSGGSLTINNKEDSSHHRFQSSSPVSVLESSSSCLVEKTEIETAPRSPETVAAGKRGRARSKRPRPATFNPRPSQLISSSSSVNENDPAAAQQLLPPKVPSDSENYAESRLLIKIPRQFNLEHKKKKKMKMTNPSASTSVDANQNPPAQAVRKCMHCEITKTPQWRAGPMGPKTLCNACGVRHKSGRLFPEYRPAASPTFIPSIHSNSHKKVLEMRSKICTSSAMVDNPPELIPNKSNPALDYI
ncbi:hypothetical protein SLEP1_g5535 [Rubroshorea leprosula]|uniref:GATA transcription factor n=1 Tax=Rubroshorea leprosula TaxID=152421 RepID=A0AAV5I2W1_9ROSI|nr:hypothetical protein SLEP1_g5535 [Rubroshorea leprosula]